MEAWRTVFRQGFAPLLSLKHLEALHEALATDDPRLIQKGTTSPPALRCVLDWPVEAACLLGYCGAVEHGGFGQATVEQVEQWFAETCFKIDNAMGEPASCRWLLNPFDDWPREEMRRNLLPEIEAEIQRRTA